MNFLQRDSSAGYLGQDLIGGGSPHEGRAFGVVRVEVSLDLGDQVGDGMEHPAAQSLVGQFSEPPLDQVQP